MIANSFAVRYFGLQQTRIGVFLPEYDTISVISLLIFGMIYYIFE